MLRSLIAVIIAVIAGFSVAKMIEGGGAALLSTPPGTTLYAALIGAGWCAGAFFAAILAMILGKRWAPLGLLAAAAILLGAIITLASSALGWWMWLVAFVSTGLGGYGGVRLLGASYAHPDLQRKDGLFDE